MNKSRLRLSIRTRLTLWYAGALALMLAVYAAGIYLFLRRSLLADLDQSLHENFEVVEGILERAPEGKIRLGLDSHHQEEANWWVEVWSLDRKLLFRSEPFEEGKAEKIGSLLPLSSQGCQTVEPPGGEPVRILTGRHLFEGEPVIIRVAKSMQPLQSALQRLLIVLGVGWPFVVGIAGLGGFFLARRALTPMKIMAGQAKKITAERLSERLPVINPGDEIGWLAVVFNDTLGRLEKSFDQLKRFTADASHELRTPLTALRSVGEVGLRSKRDENSYREIIGSMLEEADKLGQLVDSLLTLARADSGKVKLNLENLDLTGLSREVANHLGALAEEKRQTITVIGGQPVAAAADRWVIRQALINLVDNAIKYSPEGAAIRIGAFESAGAKIVEVKDSGPGIPPAHRERIFDRFYRIDRARSRNLGGTGLGLAIAKWAVEAHGGRIELESEVGKGSTFRIVLPEEAKDVEKNH
ncbi:MAG: heavy metal sensor histidine kinase [Planctomycetes bacterium]|nr:heavy metal sensor histidine kinase [Planctomycetota bacterium]